MKRQSKQRVVMFGLLFALLAPLSIFADDRPGGRTGSDSRGSVSRDLVGVVTHVAGDGDDFTLRTRRGEVRIDAKGGVRVYYRGRTYRVRDLDRGDYVAVDLQSNSRGRLRARAVEVLESVSDRGRGSSDPYGRDNDRYGRRTSVIQGEVVSLDTRRDVMVIRTDSRRDLAVDTREIERRYGPSWARSLRRGEWVTIEGYSDGRTFVARTLRSGDHRGLGR